MRSLSLCLMQVPLDGRIVCGEAMLSTEHITGESLPRRVRPGDIVAAGAINNDGLLTVQVLELAADSTPARMARLAKEAQVRWSKRPPSSHLLTPSSFLPNMGLGVVGNAAILSSLWPKAKAREEASLPATRRGGEAVTLW